MNILIATVQVPFVQGGAEILAATLKQACLEAGHQTEIVQLPFTQAPASLIPQQMLAWRLLDLNIFGGHQIDRVVCLKFPAYLVPFARKSLWLLHQHRGAYDLWGSELSDVGADLQGTMVRDMIVNADRKAFAECRYRASISRNVATRLERSVGASSEVLYPPPQGAEQFHCNKPQDYLFFPSRLTAIKRQELVIRALALTRGPVKVVFAGRADSPGYLEELRSLVASLNLGDRVAFEGGISEERKIDLYSRCRAVVYPPRDEDYGYVTLEAMLSSKCVITCRDSGGPLEFVEAGVTGWVVEPDEASLAAAMDECWDSPREMARLGLAGRELMTRMGIGWPRVLERLLS